MHAIDVLISGTGSNLQALHNKAEHYGYTIRRVLADRPCKGIDWACKRGISTAIVPWADYADRDSFGVALANVICQIGQPDVLVCAGFMRILPQKFFDRIGCAVLNIHPSLLPLFKGLHPQKQAIEAGVLVSGATVHFVTAELDAGPIIAQKAVVVEPEDSEESLQQRILIEEHKLYPYAVGLVASGAVCLREKSRHEFFADWRKGWRELAPKMYE